MSSDDSWVWTGSCLWVFVTDLTPTPKLPVIPLTNSLTAFNVAIGI